LLFLSVGIAGTAGQFCLNQAFRYGQVSLLAPLDYTGLIWAILIGYAIWSDVPTPLMLVGSGIVIACCFYILRAGSKGAPTGNAPVGAPD
jgi:drug/metabolite transporter (DMT)-like permease